MKKYLTVLFIPLVIFLFSDLGSTQIKTKQLSFKSLNRLQLTSLKKISSMINRGVPTSKINKELENFIKSSKVKIYPAPYDKSFFLQQIKNAPDDVQLLRKRNPTINDIILYILQESYFETQKNLQSYKDKVEKYNELKKAVRKEASKVRKARVNQEKGKTSQKIVIKQISLNNQRVITKTGKAVSTEKELDDYIVRLEKQLSTIEEDSRLVNFDLQNLMQELAQWLQTLSNISRAWHEACSAIIRKLS